MPARRSILIAIALAALLGPAAGWAYRRPDPLPLALTSSPAVLVSVTGGAPAKVQWGVTPAPSSQTSVGQALLIEGPAGQVYQVTAAVLSAGDVGLLQAAVTIPSTTAPAPGPGPPPGPTPVVPERRAKVWAIAVFDTSRQISLPPGQLALFKSQTVVSALAPLGVVYRHYDIGDPAVTGSVWGTAALRLQKPALVLWRNKGLVAGYPVNLPATEADLVALVKGAVQP